MTICAFKQNIVAVSLLALCGCGGSDVATSLADEHNSSELTVSKIQGPGSSSPLEGETVVFSAIVTGDFQDNDDDTDNNLGGFFVQQEAADADERTSDGIFVFDGSNPSVDVRGGDRVEVRGTVIEHFGETQVKADTVTIVGRGSIRATDVEFPVPSTTTNSDGDPVADLERYEGMLLRFPQALTASNLRFLERFGEVSLSQGGRLYQFTNGQSPDKHGYADHAAKNAARSIVLDDGSREQGPPVSRYLNAGSVSGYSIRSGDSVSKLTGNLRYSRGSGGSGEEAWRLMPTEVPVFVSDNPRPGTPEVAGAILVASFNALNLFSRIDTGKARCGPKGADACRGADSPLELQRQLEKIVSALALMDADIVGLMEVENNARESVAIIVDALNQRLSSGQYRYVDTGTIHTDGIKVGLIYDAARIGLDGDFAILDSSVDPRFDDNRNRPALAQTFVVADTGARFTVIVNHLKSKASSCESDGDPNIGDGQGNCNLARTNAAAALADWIKTDPTASGDDDFLVIGDLNAYPMEDPLTTLKDAGLINLLEESARPYSFSFDGQSGALDHALASPSLATQVRGAIEWHINSDEPPLLDYNLENGRDAQLFDPASPYRASDHDPVIVGIDPVTGAL